MPDGLLIDIAGVLHVGDHAIPAAAALARLEAEHIPPLFITNTTHRSAPALAAQLGRLGLPVPVERILSAVDATVAYLQAQHLRPHLLVHPDVRAAFDVCAQRSPNAVVLGDAGDGFDYAALNRAFRLLMGGAVLVAMGDNRDLGDALGTLFGAATAT